MQTANHPPKENLLADPQVRREVVATLYQLIPANPLVCFFVTILLIWQVVVWPRDWALLATLIAWMLVNLLYFGLFLSYQKATSQKAINLKAKDDTSLTEAASQFYLDRFFWMALLDAVVFGWVCALVYWARPDMYAVASVGCAIYLFGDVFKNTVFAKLTNLFPFVIFGPLAMAFFYEGTPLFVTLAIILSISIVAMLEFSRNNAHTLQLAIKQKYDIAKQNQDLALLTTKLEKERERADAANAAKSNFFTAASHDARQPLQVISLLFQSFKQSTSASEHDKKIIEKIDSNLKTIRTLFDRVLDISRIDSGHVTPSMQAMSLQALFDKLDAQFGEHAANRGLWLRFVPTTDLVIHDTELLDRMTSNLIHNAIKYTDKGGVWVAWRATRQRLEIRDSGVGISNQDQGLIFEEFAQLNNPSRNNDAGLGLGLSIVKRLAQLSQTPFGLASAKDRGSCFWLGLTRTTQSAESIGLQMLASDMPVLNIPGAISSTMTSLAGMHVLYAEDEPQLLELFSTLLREKGATVHACKSAMEAKAILQSEARIDVVLTDYRLGEGGSGLVISHMARARAGQDNPSRLPVVLLTGDTAVKDLEAIRRLENSLLLHKPLDLEELTRALQSMVQSTSTSLESGGTVKGQN